MRIVANSAQVPKVAPCLLVVPGGGKYYCSRPRSKRKPTSPTGAMPKIKTRRVPIRDPILPDMATQCVLQELSVRVRSGARPAYAFRPGIRCARASCAFITHVRIAIMIAVLIALRRIMPSTPARPYYARACLVRYGGSGVRARLRVRVLH
jgi:hypothetical protein